MDLDNLDTDKKRALQALHEHHGVVTNGCESIGLARSTFYNWLKTDEVFKLCVEDVQEAAIDFVEGKLFNNIQNGDTGSIIFFLKTRGKKRGYVERTEHTGADGNPLFGQINWKDADDRKGIS